MLKVFLGSKSFRVIRVRKKRPQKNKPDYKAHKENARELIMSRLEHFAYPYGFSYGQVSIRNQSTRWGSCSRKGNLNFNYRLVHLPLELLDYVVVHELCHLKEFNHSRNFWDLVAQAIPDYRERRRQLKNIKMN